MSGGALNYAEYHFKDVGEQLLRSKEREHRVLGVHILKLAEVIHEVEWVLSGDYSPGKDVKMIRDLLGNSEITRYHIEELRTQIAEAQDWLNTLSNASHPTE